MSDAAGYNWAELMAVCISREAANGEMSAVGAAADIPLAGLRLAQLTHAPDLSIMCGGSGGLNPDFDRLTESSSDYRNLVNSEFRYSLEDVVDFEASMRLDFGFVGGLQIDKFGNANMAFIGDWKAPTVRGPGSVGLVFLGGLRRSYVYTEHHTPRVLVDRVDFRSGVGWLDGGDSRAQVLRPESEGPRRLFTPFAVFDFPPPERHARLLSITPGFGVEDIRARTGFELLVAPDLGETPPPTPAELHVLRTRVDVDGVLRRRPEPK